ncbi:MAG: response regulator [Pseudomonadota bacterium]|nr:response regulator [Pseudomonadota bacterium]
MDETSDQLPLIAIVDDNRDVRTTTGRGLAKMGYRCHPFASGQDLLDALGYLKPDCILLDLRMPGINGLETLRAIPENKRYIPVIFFTSHGDIPTAIEAMKSGASDFIEKPGTFAQIAQKVELAMENAKPQRDEVSATNSAKDMVDLLTAREKEVLRLACNGMKSKEIAEELSLGPRTIDAHRYNAIQKLEVRTLPDIIHLFHQANAL